MRYEKEFDEQISDYLVKSSILSWMSINVWLKSEESFKFFASMLSKFGDDKVIWFEFWGNKDYKKIDFEMQLSQNIFISNSLNEIY